MESLAFIVELLLVVIEFSNGKGNKGCQYQYNQQPETTLECNPYGSQLQLHCGVTGPLLPTFTIEWYFSSARNATVQNSDMNLVKLSSLSEYRIENIILDVMNETRSVSSILLTNSITSEHARKCFWCQIDFKTLQFPHTSNVLCIEDQEYYTTVLRNKPCMDEGSIGTMLINTTPLCVDISDNEVDELQRLKKELTINTLFDTVPTRSYFQTVRLDFSKPHPTHSIHEANDEESIFGMMTPKPSLTDDNIATYSLHTLSPVAMTISQTQAMTTPRSTQSGSSVSFSVGQLVASTLKIREGKMDETVPRSSFEGALYAAIVVCIMFVGVILVLIVVIICLLKKKCSCLRQVGATSSQAMRQLARLRDRQRNTDDSNCSQLAANDANRRSNVNSSLVESGIHVEHSELDTYNEDQNILTKDTPDSGPQPLAYNERSVDHWKPPISRQASNKDNQLPPELPPKPRKANTLPTNNYDHLDPTKTPNTCMDSDISAAHLEGDLLTTSLELPPKKPPRSRSGEHFYHTLERSDDDSGLLRSATASHTSSQAHDLDHRDGENLETMSGQLRELFDDPRYAMLNLNSQGGEEGQIVSGLTKRRDFSRSTPSIVTLLQPTPEIQFGVPERRSLRLPKWLSANKTHEIYDN